MDSTDDLAQVVRQTVRQCQRAGFSRADAEDCVQDALLALLRRQADEPDAEPIVLVQRWPAVTAHRRLIDQARRTGRERQALARLQARTPPSADPGETVSDRELATWLLDALERLPEATQQVCRAVATGASVDETALRLGLTRRSVQSHLTRARRLLRYLAAGVAATLAGSVGKVLRATTAAAGPVTVAATAVAVTLLPHHGAMPGPAIGAPPPTVHPDTTNRHPEAPTRDTDPRPTPTTPTTPTTRPAPATTPGPGDVPTRPEADASTASTASSVPADTAAPPQVPAPPPGPEPPPANAAGPPFDRVLRPLVAPPFPGTTPPPGGARGAQPPANAGTPGAAARSPVPVSLPPVPVSVPSPPASPSAAGASHPEAGGNASREPDPQAGHGT